MEYKETGKAVATLTVHLDTITDDTRKDIVLWLRSQTNLLLWHSDKLNKKRYTAKYILQE